MREIIFGFGGAARAPYPAVSAPKLFMHIYDSENVSETAELYAINHTGTRTPALDPP